MRTQLSLPKLALVSALALAGLTACGSGSTPTTSPTPTPSETSVTTPPSTGTGATALTVTLTNGKPVTYHLTCNPTGGDHPNAQAACEQVLAAGPAAFKPVPPGTKCTQQYGGPQRATVTGTVNGTAVNASFSLSNGCEIARWDTLALLLGPAGA